MKKNLLLLVCLSFISILVMGQKYEMTQKSNKIAEFKSRMLVSTSKAPQTLIKLKSLKTNELEANQLVMPKTIQKSNLKSVIVKKSTIDTTHIYPWDFNKQDWGTVPIARLLKYYDEKQNLVQYRALSWHSDIESWVDSVQFFYKYNESNLIETTLQQRSQLIGKEYKWVNVDNTTTEYNDLGQETKYLYKYWDCGISEWVDSWQHEFTYDANGNNTIILESYWDSGNYEWIPSLNFISTYDEQNHFIDNPIQFWDYWMSEWVNAFRYSFKYDSKGNNTEMLLQTWNFDVGDWENAQFKTMVYNESNKIESFVFQNWDIYSYVWIDSQRGTYKYDLAGNNISIIGQNFDPYSNTWNASWQNFYDYNDQNKQISSATLYWDASFGNWLTGSKTKSLKIPTSGQTVTPILNETKIFPNPSKGLVNIQNPSAIEEVLMFDLKGNKLLINQCNGLSDVQFDITNFASGIYILKIKSSDGTMSNKTIMKQ